MHKGKDSWCSGTRPASHVTQVNRPSCLWGLRSRAGNGTDVRGFGKDAGVHLGLVTEPSFLIWKRVTMS